MYNFTMFLLSFECIMIIIMNTNIKAPSLHGVETPSLIFALDGQFSSSSPCPRAAANYKPGA